MPREEVGKRAYLRELPLLQHVMLLLQRRSPQGRAWQFRCFHPRGPQRHPPRAGVQAKPHQIQVHHQGGAGIGGQVQRTLRLHLPRRHDLRGQLPRREGLRVGLRTAPQRQHLHRPIQGRHQKRGRLLLLVQQQRNVHRRVAGRTAPRLRDVRQQGQIRGDLLQRAQVRVRRGAVRQRR